MVKTTTICSKVLVTYDKDFWRENSNIWKKNVGIWDFLLEFSTTVLHCLILCDAKSVLGNQDLSTSLTKHEQLFGPSYLIHTRHTVNEDGLKRLAIYSPDLNCSRGPFWSNHPCCLWDYWDAPLKQSSVEARDVDVKVIIIKLFVCKWNGWKNGWTWTSRFDIIDKLGEVWGNSPQLFCSPLPISVFKLYLGLIDDQSIAYERWNV